MQTNFTIFIQIQKTTDIKGYLRLNNTHTDTNLQESEVIPSVKTQIYVSQVSRHDSRLPETNDKSVATINTPSHLSY